MTSSIPTDKKRNLNDGGVFRRGVIFILIAGFCLAFSWFILFSGEKSTQIQKKTTDGMIRPVTVIQARPGVYQMNIEAYGEVSPQLQVTIKSKVQGEVVEVSENFRKGNILKAGEQLVGVEQTDYRVQLADAYLALKESKAKLLVEEKEGQDALAAWQRSGITTQPSQLLLRKPYLEIAKADLAAAEERVKQAQLFMDRTRIKAPFEALVVERNISIGGTVFVGDEVGVLFGMKTFVVTLHIGKKEWEKLPLDWKGLEVLISDEEFGNTWVGKLARKGKLIEADSRLRTLFIEIDDPLQQSPPLLPGSFVKAKIPGRSVPHLLRIPDSALTPQGIVWYVDEQNLLKSIKVFPTLREKGQLFFTYQGKEAVAVVINPNNSFVNGLKVTPTLKEN